MSSFTRDPIRVLLVDDDEDDFIMIRDLLLDVAKEYYSLDWVSSFDEGLEHAGRREHQVCLVDYRLGERSGLDLIRQVLASGGHTPMILLTGYGDDDVDLEAMRSGASDFLVKGQITPQLLARTIRYSIKHAVDLAILREREATIVHQDRLASIGLLASGLAHEIGTPLGVIRGRAEYLSMLIEQGGSNDQARKGLEIIINQIDRISKLIYSLLHLARGEKSAQITEVRLRSIIDQVIGLMIHEFKKNSIELDDQVGAQAIAQAEVEPLLQVCLNLLVNAVHAIESARKGGRPTGHRISIKLADVGAFWQMSFEDTGCGISEKNMSNLFKPFFTTKEIGVGTGLGLATSYRIVQSWGGSIQVQSCEGVGSVFKVSLPKGK